MRRLPLLLVLALAASAPAFAQGDAGLDPSLRGRDSLTDVSAKTRPHMLSFFVNIPAFYYGWGGVPFGVGGRYMLPILHNGLAPELNDSISLEFGADLLAVGGLYWGLGIPIEALWTLYIVPRFAAYLKLGVALEVHFGNWCYGAVCGVPVVPGFIGAVGGMFKLSEAISLRFELGYPGFKVGLGFNL
jgi:hypothetical protein